MVSGCARCGAFSSCSRFRHPKASIETPTGIAPFLFPGIIPKGSKDENMKTLLFAVFVPLALTAQFAPTINETTVIVSTPPRYELWQGVDVAIQNVQKLGKPLILKNVLAEIDRMVGANDIRRPYRYNFSSSFSFNGRKAKGRSNRTLDADNKKKKAEFEQGVARRISQMTGKSIEDVGEPVPSRYTTKDEFVRAYVNAKMQDVDDETRKKYSRKIGGMGDYRRDLKREAEAQWRQIKGR